jgi:hypothetical protein
MPTSLYISIGLFVLYVALLFITTGSQFGGLRVLPGIFYFLFCGFFLYFANEYWESWWITLLTVLLLLIFMYAIQLPIGAIMYRLNQKRNQLD